MVIKYLDQGDREYQEDACEFFQNNNTALIVLGDGLGGHCGGELASRYLIQETKKSFETLPNIIDESFFNNIVHNLSKKINSLKTTSPQHNPNTTCAFALIQDNRVHIAHIGDSRVYIFSNKKLFFRTKDHSYVQMLVELGDIKEDQINSHSDKNKLLKSIGIKPQNVTYSSFKIDNEFRIVVCSDGFWEHLKVDEISALAYSKNLKKDIPKHIDLIKTRSLNNSDNISVAVYTEEKYCD